MPTVREQHSLTPSEMAANHISGRVPHFGMATKPYTGSEDQSLLGEVPGQDRGGSRGHRRP